MRIDLHVHTKTWSDGSAPVDGMIAAAIEHGLDGMAVADHNRMLQADEQRELAKKFPGFRVFRAAEVSLPDRVHVLVVGGSGEHLPPEKPTPPAVLKEYVDRTGAFAVYCHPFWMDENWSLDFDVFRPEAMDVLSMNMDTARLGEIVRKAREHDMRPIAFSDAHDPRHVGLFHINLDNRVLNDEELLRELRAGRYALAAAESPWRERISEVGAAEELARRVLRGGGTLEDYHAQGGVVDVFFTRLARGGSHMPRESLLGLRGTDWPDAG